MLAGKLSGSFEIAKARFVQWDESFRSKFRNLPISKYLKWTNLVVTLPVVVRMAIERAKTGASVGQLMTFRSDMTVASGHRLFRTEEGHIGLAPSLAKERRSHCGH